MSLGPHRRIFNDMDFLVLTTLSMLAMDNKLVIFPTFKEVVLDYSFRA